jgi:hypothetical protein
MINLALGGASLVVWLHLLVGRGWSWRGEGLFDAVRPDNERRFDGNWPRVTAIVPAREFYGRPVLSGLALPAIPAAHMLFTVQSAAQYWLGQGGLWKRRIQAPMPRAEPA